MTSSRFKLALVSYTPCFCFHVLLEIHNETLNVTYGINMYARLSVENTHEMYLKIIKSILL